MEFMYEKKEFWEPLTGSIQTCDPGDVWHASDVVLSDLNDVFRKELFHIHLERSHYTCIQ